MTEHRYSKITAISVVVGNMIGTGVFTSLGFQLADIQSVFVLMMLWFVGGITALCGALTYAELGASMPRSGGEYNFLSRLYHPCLGFISGWISATVGFAAPTALAAMAFGAYLAASVEGISPVVAATSLVVILTALHSYSRKASGGTQVIFTFLKLILIIAFCFLVLMFAQSPQPLNLIPSLADKDMILGSTFAVSLIYVNFAYTGWNAATYITEELEEPQRNLPTILFVGTALVALIYLLLNFSFLYAAPMASMEGKLEIGVIVAEHAFGGFGGKAMGVTLALLLISTISAMIIAGPRVLQVIGEDFKVFGFLSVKNKHGVPSIAVVSLGSLAVIFILTSTFESVLVFSGFILGINSLFTVAGVFILRWRKMNVPGAYRTFGYPLTPLIYMSITLWTLTYILINRPVEGWTAIAIIAVGAVLYFVSSRGTPRLNSSS